MPAQPLRGGERRQVGRFVLPAVDPPRLEAPDLGSAGAVAERLEGERRLHRPAAVEAAHGEVPDRVPVQIHLRLVRRLRVDAPADRRHLEHDHVAPVVERVERPGEVVVPHDPDVVPPHLVRDDPVGARFPAAGDHVDVVVVEEQPHLGPLRRRRSLDRVVLDEVGHRRNLRIDLFIEIAVDVDPLPDACRAHGDAAGVAHDHGGRYGRRRSEDLRRGGGDRLRRGLRSGSLRLACGYRREGKGRRRCENEHENESGESRHRQRPAAACSSSHRAISSIAVMPTLPSWQANSNIGPSVRGMRIAAVQGRVQSDGSSNVTA